jgi:multidrug efflux pump subunit AcrB
VPRPVQARQLQDKLDEWSASGALPEGYSVALSGETSTVNDIMSQMFQWLALALPFVYLVMVAQFQSLLSPFIVLFTIPLAFTGGMIGLLGIGEQLSMMSLMGFIVLMGTVVNNGILFVDYTNQLRLGGMDRRDALVATGKTRMRPILMTALTTILGMMMVLFSNDMASQLMSSMSIVIIGGLTYATFMTLYIVPMMYDLFFKRMPHVVDIGSEEDLDDVPDDAAEFLAQQAGHKPTEA